MFRAMQPQPQENLQERQEREIRAKINLIDLKNPENSGTSLATISAILGILQGGQFSREFIEEMYYATRDKVDEHHERADESFMALPLEARRLISRVNVEFGRIHEKFKALWEEGRNNLTF